MKNLTVSQLQPMAGYVLVEPAKAETKTASGIILPESDSEKPQYGTVLAVGEADCSDCGSGDDCCGGCGDGHYGCGNDEGHEHPEKKSKKSDKHDKSCGCEDCEGDCAGAPVEVGDQVVYKKWGGNDVTIDDVEYQFLKFEDILAVIKKK